MVFGLMRLGIEPDSTVLIADAAPIYTSLNAKASPEKKSINVDLLIAQPNTNIFLEFIALKQLVFGHLVRQITCYRN